VPYDFLRKRLSILVVKDGAHLMVTKGAVSNVIDVCSCVELTNGCRDIAGCRDDIERQCKSLGSDGFRTLGLAYKRLGDISQISKQHEAGMTFLGLR